MGGLRYFNGYIKREIIGIFLITLSILTFLCLLSPSGGFIAFWVEKGLRISVGEGRYVLPFGVLLWGLKLIRGNVGVVSYRIVGGILLFLVSLVLLNGFTLQGLQWQEVLQGKGGGFLGAAFYMVLDKSFGNVGSMVVLIAVSMVGFILYTRFSIRILSKKMVKNIRQWSKRSKSTFMHFMFEEIPEHRFEAVSHLTMSEGCRQEEVHRDMALRHNAQISSHKGVKETMLDEEDGFRLPSLSLLSKKVLKNRSHRSSKELYDNIKILEETLANFGVQAKVTHVSRGPVITRYEISPPRGVKVSRIVGLADDIALSMAAPDVRIEAPVPGKAVVGIEVPNLEVNMVHIRELLESPEFQTASSKLTVTLGKDIAGQVVVADLSTMPHLLIAGATGSGKSVCLNTIIASILYKATPEQVKFLIIDPKMVELITYNGIPHLISPVVTDPKKSATALRWAVKEMEYRYHLFASAGVRDIDRYNHLMSAEKCPPLPYIMVIIDELADLMMIAPHDVEDSICRLAQMARAAGMHLVIATQRPSVDVITGLIKANIPSRISFAVSSQVDSRTILDMGGAEKLLGKGDMLFIPVGAAKAIRLQGAYLSDGEVENLVKFWRKQAEPVYNDSMVKEMQRPNIENQQVDELFSKAVAIFMETGHASISLLQRRLRIGYARAAKLIDRMEKEGIVGGYEGSKPRAVLITTEQYESKYKI